MQERKQYNTICGRDMVDFGKSEMEEGIIEFRVRARTRCEVSDEVVSGICCCSAYSCALVV